MPTDYEQLAPGYDQRYRDRAYGGVKQTLVRALAPLDGPVVEVGCGTGQWVAALREHDVRAFGLDLSPGMLQRARQRADGLLLHASASQLPLRSRSTAAVYCVHAAHHFVDRRAFLREAARVLVVSGTLLVIGLDPHRDDLRWVVYEYWQETRERDLLRYPSTESWCDLGCDVGLTLLEYTVAEHLKEVRPAARLLADSASLKLSTSQLADLSTDEYQAGLTRLQHAARGAGAPPLQAHTDLKLCVWRFRLDG
ncbi:MAG TPA: class I SAM-dependent methyltransferase [Polyangiales bacterium]